MIKPAHGGECYLCNAQARQLAVTLRRIAVTQVQTSSRITDFLFARCAGTDLQIATVSASLPFQSARGALKDQGFTRPRVLSGTGPRR